MKRQWEHWGIWGTGEGRWDGGRSQRITTEPPGSLTEYVTVQEKKTLLTKTKQSFSQHVTGSQKPQSLREMNNLIKEQSGHIHRHQQDRASESYPVGKNLNSGKRHLMGDVHRHGVN